jgi:hypothetical protein
VETQAERLVDKIRQGHGERSDLIERQADCRGFAVCINEAEKNRADDPRQLKRAMLATIFLGLDPIWTRYNLRLTRWDCGDITMDEARLLNPSWADLADHINELLHQMPPRWHVEGAR